MLSAHPRHPRRLAPKARKWAARAAALGVTTAVLAGCSGGQPGEAPAPASSATTITVSPDSLGAVLERLVFHGGTPHVLGPLGDDPAATVPLVLDDIRECLVSAVHRAGLPTATQAHLVAIHADDLGAAAAGLLEHVDPAAGDALLGRALRADLDACANRAILGGRSYAQAAEALGVGPRANSESADQDSPRANSESTQPHESGYLPPDRTTTSTARSLREPDLAARYEVRPTDIITVVPQLTDGLVSVFGSYALDDTQRETYRDAAPCLAWAVLSAGEPGKPAETGVGQTRDNGFTQDTLRFLAGGAPVGTGSLAEHLPHAADRELWRSASFRAALQRCVTAAQTAPTPRPSPTATP